MSGTDKAIKRFLSIVGKSLPTCTFNSRYWVLEYESGLRIRIRFSNHFKTVDKENLDIDITKTSYGFYTFRFPKTGMSETMEESDVFIYLKSSIRLYPTIFECCSCLLKGAQDNLRLANKFRNELAKNKEFTDLVDSIYDENKKLKNIVNSLMSNNNQLNKQIAELNTKIAKLEKEKNELRNKYITRCNEFTSINSKFQQLIKILKV